MHGANDDAGTLPIEQCQRTRTAPLVVGRGVVPDDRASPKQHVERAQRRQDLVAQVRAIQLDALHARLHTDSELDQIDRLSRKQGLLCTPQTPSPARGTQGNDQGDHGKGNTNTTDHKCRVGLLLERQWIAGPTRA